MKLLSLLFSLCVLFLLFRCGSDDPAPITSPEEPQFEFFIKAEQTQTHSRQSLQVLALLAGIGDFISLLKHDVTVYKITYATTYKGESIEASGLAFIPQNLTSHAPLVSLHHGTTFVKADAPSASNSFTGVEFFASAGYISIMPDYIGYGKSASIFHPYYDYEHSALAVIDMIKAIKEFLEVEEILFNDKLFLTGYSEGGYVTLAAAKELETNSTHGLTTTAVAAGAGGYDLRHMLDGILEDNYYGYPSYLAFIIMSYNITYDWNKPLTYFFNEPYATALSTYMNGEHDGGFINTKLTTEVDQFLHPAFYNGMKSPEGEEDFKTALSNNSVAGWNSSLPIRLYHGTADEIIPYENSTVTLQQFQVAGSTEISLTPIPDGTHSNSFIPMLALVVPWFESLK